MTLSRQTFEMHQIMADFVQQGVNMFCAGFMRINQNPLLARKKLPVNIILKITDKYDLQAKVLGYSSKDVFGPVFHLPFECPFRR